MSNNWEREAEEFGASGKAKRKLIVLCDGTFNDPLSRTNVFQFKSALARPNQLVYYDAGVGISEEGNAKGWFGRTVDRMTGGAFGSGLSMNVQQAYRWICENYEIGDDLYFLGFSRGAFTVRSIVGMIRKIGLIRAPVDIWTLGEAFARYRDDHHPECPVTADFRSMLNTLPVENISLRFLGVWDTVGALGVPVVGPRSWIARKRWGFHDTRLSRHVQTARQALAIDERRAAFLPSMWSLGAGEVDVDRDVRQVWFAGCHSDIGGRDGKIAFHWMLEEAAAAGLMFSPPLAERPRPTEPQILHESLSLAYRLLAGSVRRPIVELVGAAGKEQPRFLNESISTTAGELWEEDGAGGQETRTHKAIPVEMRENLGLEGMREPKPSWGFALGYYLRQSDLPPREPADCCTRYRDSRTQPTNAAPGS